jgi:hypothetical protein
MGLHSKYTFEKDSNWMGIKLMKFIGKNNFILFVWLFVFIINFKIIVTSRS